jgi:hypothetical protein
VAAFIDASMDKSRTLKTESDSSAHLTVLGALHTGPSSDSETRGAFLRKLAEIHRKLAGRRDQ